MFSSNFFKNIKIRYLYLYLTYFNNDKFENDNKKVFKLIKFIKI